MALQYANATVPSRFEIISYWLLSGVAMTAAVVGFAFMAAAFSPPAGGGTVATPEIPAIGSIPGGSLAIGERPFAYLEFDWPPTSGVPGFDLWQEPNRLVADASAG